jgi:hypothetical protein
MISRKKYKVQGLSDWPIPGRAARPARTYWPNRFMQPPQTKKIPPRIINKLPQPQLGHKP